MTDNILTALCVAGLLIGIAIAPGARAADYGPYQVQLVEVIDGDTLKVDVGLWPGLVQRTSVRVLGVNTPELRSGDKCERDAGRDAKAFVQGRIMNAERIVIENIKPDKFAGRVLADVFLDGKNLADMLIATGHGREYKGEARGPWCEQ